MLIDWSRRRALERRMRGRVFQASSRALGAAVVSQTVGPITSLLSRGPAQGADVIFACRVHGVAGHLAAIHDAGSLPADVHAAVGVEAGRIAERASRLSDDIRALGQAAQAAGLPFVPLKGSYLRSERYADPNLRPSSDIDLLVRAEELPSWRRLLHERGHTREHTTARHWTFTRPAEAPIDVDGEHPDNPRPIELHGAIGDRVFGDEIDVTDAYRADLRSGHILGSVPALVPGDIGLVLHLFLHAAAAMLNRGMRLAQVLDFAYVDGSATTRHAVRALIAGPAWAVAHLAEREVPGVLPRAWLADDDIAPPSRWRQLIIGTRPGLLRGDPHRLSTLTGELLLSLSARGVVERVRQALRDRQTLNHS